ncbi:MAG: hypothetical protein HZA20_07280 [Nitrospirae bacterium]|nr:hypothetical protein [Nitrospirota bacterium]
MEKLRDNIFYAAAGASCGLSGLAAVSRCGGSSCTSCMGCAGAGAGILLIALFQKFKGWRRRNGMA